ncbi:rhomboid family intramembrane serine protease [Chromobacterium sphagni]|uniref:Peptidase S54 rhomboid domain-containing protein n=1 Tax=Chromobacterium sphagni TaxID=1903179 RepID=A0A1S1X038_9NEIS|nr:rhomboid family intramembrane serine protease [Chromobacterium sphagni]OHX12884.1 hypothetical protein BI347_04710 [Chromobacterium sphagni]OHX19909.1 hypothetical protein BI344_16370 [Chromobacterium sphagni]
MRLQPSLLPALLPLCLPVGEAARRWRFDPALAADEWWRCWSGSWVHADWRHALFNSAGLLLLAWLGGPGHARLLCWLALLLPCPIALVQLALPHAGPFLGASGVLYGWWAALAWQWRRDGSGWLLALLLLSRLGWQWVWPQTWAGGQAVLWSAHASGALAGLLLAACFSRAARAAPASPPRTSVHS